MSNVEELYKALKEKHTPTREYFNWLNQLKRTTITFKEWRSNVVEKITAEPTSDLEDYLSGLCAIHIGQLQNSGITEDVLISDIAKEMIQYLRDKTITPVINTEFEEDTEASVRATYEPIIPGSPTRPTFVIPGIELSAQFRNLIALPLQADLATASTILTCTRLHDLAGV